jgi:hypothetical protein
LDEFGDLIDGRLTGVVIVLNYDLKEEDLICIVLATRFQLIPAG